MKKNISVFLLSIFLSAFPVVLYGCATKESQMENTVIFGILQQSGNGENLMFYVPEKGVYEFPEFQSENDIPVLKEGYVYEKSLKSGDLIGIKFSEKNVVFSETYPLQILTPAELIYHYKENVCLRHDGKNYLLSYGREDYQKECFGNPPQIAGEKLEILKAEFLTGESQGSSRCGVATIKNISDDSATLRLEPTNGITDFIHAFAIGATAFIPLST